jgi:hypothetical protein
MLAILSLALGLVCDPFWVAPVESASRNGMTDSDSRTWIMLRIGRPAVQSHKRKESVCGEIKVCRFGCPCRDDCSRSSGARRGGKGAGDNTESRRVDSETGKETGTCGAVAVSKKVEEGIGLTARHRDAQRLEVPRVLELERVVSCRRADPWWRTKLDFGSGEPFEKCARSPQFSPHPPHDIL